MTEQAIPWDQLFAAATAAQKRAYAPYSKFRVGAALLTADGAVYEAANVENASYGLSICAERNVLCRAIFDAAPVRITALAIVTDARSPTPPCGACRQTMAEFCEPSLPVHSRTLAGDELRSSLGELLPHAFTPSSL